MAADTYDAQQRITFRVQIEQLQIDVLNLRGRVDRQDARLNQTVVVAYLAAAGGLLFGLVNFVLLLQLLGRL